MAEYVEDVYRHPDEFEDIPVVFTAGTLHSFMYAPRTADVVLLRTVRPVVVPGQFPDSPAGFNPYGHLAVPVPETVSVVLKGFLAADAARGEATTPTPMVPIVMVATGSIQRVLILMTRSCQGSADPEPDGGRASRHHDPVQRGDPRGAAPRNRSDV